MRIVLNITSIGLVAFFLMHGNRDAAAQCPYSSIQLRVQPDSSTPWTSSLTLSTAASVHIGVMKNGSGYPIDQGGVAVYLVQGSYNELILFNGWDTWIANKPAGGTYTLHAYCGSIHGTATVSWPLPFDTLPYVFPNAPAVNAFANITNRGNPWRTFDSNGLVNERLPGFFITKGSTYTGPGNSLLAWEFEQMIYDSNWIYLVRDTSWATGPNMPVLCTDNNHAAGMLLFTSEGGQWLRGGRHFPRVIQNGGQINTGEKLIQGVEIKKSPTDSAIEGRWCPAQFAGLANTIIRADRLGARTMNNVTFKDVLQLSAVGASGEGDLWWFAKGYGLIKFKNANDVEKFSERVDPYEVGVRIPCAPNAACM